MSWRKYLPHFQVPRLVDKLVAAGILKDKTSSRDAVPHFETTLLNKKELVMWVDHPEASSRAGTDGPRYGIEIWEADETPKTVFASNNLKETLGVLQEILREQGIGPV